MELDEWNAAPDCRPWSRQRKKKKLKWRQLNLENVEKISESDEVQVPQLSDRPTK